MCISLQDDETYHEVSHSPRQSGHIAVCQRLAPARILHANRLFLERRHFHGQLRVITLAINGRVLHAREVPVYVLVGQLKLEAREQHG